MSRFLEVFGFEVRLHLRRPVTWLGVALLLLAGLMCVLGLGTETGVHVNAPALIVMYGFVLGFVGVLVTAALFADAGCRDALTRTQPLFQTTPLRKAEYLAGRYLGALVVNALVLLAIPLGLALAMLWPGLDPAMVGPFRLDSYLRAYGFFLLPGLLVNSAILYAIAALTRRTITTYLAVIGLYVAYGAAVGLSADVLHRDLGTLLDPTGIVAVFEMMRDWSPAEQNTHVVELGGRLLLNRAIWLSVGFAVLALAYARFRFAHEESRERRPRDSSGGDAEGVAHVAPIHAAPAPRAFGMAAQLHRTLAVARRSFLEIVGGREFQLIVVGAVLYAVVLGWEMVGDRFGTPAWPVTGTVARFLTSSMFGIPLTLLAVFYAGELVWRERDTGLGDIVDATPVADWVPLAGKTLALCLVLALLQGVLLLAGVLLQALQRYLEFELGLYVQILFGLKLVDYLLFAVVAMLVHALVNQKYVGHLVAVLFYVATLFAGRFGVRHNLVVYGSDGGWVYSDLSGFGPFLEPYLLTKLYWTGWALLLLLLGSLVWVRGRELAARQRVRLARARLTRRVLAAALPAAILVLTTGGFVFYNTNVLNDYLTPDESDARQAEYERRYKRWQGRAQPKIAHVQLRVELFPEERRVSARGSYLLVNRSAEAMDSVLVLVRPFLVPRAMGFDRPARQVTADRTHDVWIYALERPLAPGDSMRLRFDLAFEPRGFRDQGAVTSVVGNGTYVEREWFPAIGYQRAEELSDPGERRDHGLPPQTPRPLVTDSAARTRVGSSTDADLITYDAVIGTAGDQLVSSAGTLRRTWTEGGRRYAHFRSAAPMPNTFSVLSARYAVRESSRSGVRVQLLHHPTHTRNVDRILAAADRSLEYYTRSFGPNPYREVRIAEFPRYLVKASAYPNQVAHSESFGFVSRVRDEAGDLDTPLLVTAHELAHQWWGGQIMPAAVQGGPMLTETLANYSAMLVLDQAHGREAVRRFRHLMLVEYLNRRGRGDQPLLLTADNDNVHYRKGAVVMWTLREYLGEERVNAALRAFLAKHRAAGPPYPTTLDLLRELRAVTPDSLGWLLTDLVETITIWDLRTNAARAEPIGGGRYRVTLEVEAGKARVDTLGAHAPIPMDDLVEIAVFGAEEGAKPLYLATHRVTTGVHAITVEVAGKPARAGVDPHYLLVARRGDDLSDNVREVRLDDR